ncbi:UBN2_2 domain-containing protein [Tanacetum coccineum]
MSASILTSNTGYMSGIEPLTGTNFSTWRDQVKLTLEVMNLDHALRIDPPAALTAESTADQKRACEQWERSNRMSLMIIKNSISVAIRGAILDSQNAKEYLSSVEEQFKGTSKAHASTLILKMLTTKYYGVSGVREHIMMMSDMANKLKGMDMEISEGFLVHFIMTSLPMQFGHFKINYNTQKEKWKMSELIAMCVQEEERLKFKKLDVVHVATTNSNKRKGSWKSKGSSGDNSTLNKVQKTDTSTSSFQAVQNATFAIRKGILKRIVRNLRNGEQRKGFYTIQRLERNQRTVKVGNGVDLNVEAIGTLSLKLEGGFSKVENTNLTCKIKVVRSDRGCEYYGRHTDVGQAPRSFFDFCKDHGIINQYTMSGTPQQNGVAERRNRTLMDMENEPNLEINVEPQETQQPLRSSQRNRQPTNFDDYYTYLNEADFDLGKSCALNPLRSNTCDNQLVGGLSKHHRQWYLKFDEVMKKHNFIRNQVDQCVYLKMSGSNFIILVLYVDDILLASNNIDLLHESKRFLSRNFDMKDLGEASYVIGIEIHRDRANGKLGLS